MADRYEKLDTAEYWFHDGLRIIESASFFVMENVDMHATQEIIAQLRQQGIKGTYTHVVVRATALALTRHPELNRLFLRKRVVYPQAVDIGLTVSSELSITVPPSFVLQNAGQKTLAQLAQEIIQRAAETRSSEPQRVATLRKLARLFPTSWLRRSLLRLMLSRLSVVRERTGTFHVTSLPHLHQGVPFKPPTPAVLAFARVEDRVVVRNGQPTVRSMATLSIAGNNRLWNGNSATVLLNEIKKILEEGELAEELTGAEAGIAVH